MSVDAQSRQVNESMAGVRGLFWGARESGTINELLLILFNGRQWIQDFLANFQILRPSILGAPAVKSLFACFPAIGQIFVGEVDHLSLLHEV